MRDRLRHRGPDDTGLYLDPQANCALAHTRLSILDLSDAAHQPMTTEDGRFTIVFNGEIYNFKELRAELDAEGVPLRSHSDTEVLLHLYKRSGSNCLDQLDGMFAFAIWDSLEETCFFARDPLGIKPIYLWHRPGQLAFASEVRALLEANLGTRRLSVGGLAEYLLHGSVQEPWTLVDGIQMLPAGHYATWRLLANDHPPKTVRYWDVNWNRNEEQIVSSEEAAERTRTAFGESIRRHFVSDVPVGVFLSGGIDSTAVVAMAKANGHSGIDTFCIGFEEAEYDEGDLARRTAQHFGTDHHCWKMTPNDGKNLIGEFLDHLDQPSNDGFNTYCVAKFARDQGLKVVLSGLGGDELFGGYPSFERIPNLVRWGRASRWLGPLRSGIAAIGQNPFIVPKARRLSAYLGTQRGHSAAYWAMRGFFTPREVDKLIRTYTGVGFPGAVSELLDSAVPQQPCEKDVVSYLELTRYMRNQLLRDSDVMSMANSLELRVPFVDRKLIESLRGIPSSIRHATGKRLILDAVPEIPKWIANQPKQGFRFPFDRWIAAQWGDLFASIDAWSPVPLGQWYRQWILFTLNHFLRENKIEVAGTLP